MTKIYDLAIIGAGVIGCALAREFSRRGHSVALLDSLADFGDGTSKANTAILHTGFDATPGTLESRLVAQGYALLLNYAQQVGIAYENTGAILVAWDTEQVATLPKLQEKARANGYLDTEIIDADAVYSALPQLGPGALGGLTVPGESIIDPWSTSLAFINDATEAGLEFLREHRVTAVRRDGGVTTVTTSAGSVQANWVINAAGLGADIVDRLFGYDRFTVTPRRGELIVFDKAARALVPKIVLPVPTSRGKGVLVAPTVFGNAMLGPTSEDLEDRSDRSTGQAGIATLLEKGRRIMPLLLNEEVTATYAGLRAAIDHPDYFVDVDAGEGYVCLGGIRSTGLTSSLALAEHVNELMVEAGLPSRMTDGRFDSKRVPNLGESFPRPYQQAELIREDPAYGEIVCFCERVTKGEVRDALNSPVPPGDLGGLKRRTRVMMGRCQGFYCGAAIECLFNKDKHNE
ncbi:NAD(P)/FAD-dependent oxidoreductase [Leifsonia kafniensis]|uniref:NAD(P)/FAD-dependent oxidoreductase n=1 Tax=Leifsonia kafniensis TaxID=475957 RepID=A0ABP7KWP6_9MICO